MCTNKKLKTDCVLFSTLLHLTADTEEIKNIHYAGKEGRPLAQSKVSFDGIQR